MRLSRVATRFRNVYKKDNGERFYGDILSQGKQENSNFEFPRLVLRVGPKARVAVGDVIHTKTGRTYLCADRSDNDSAYLVSRTFTLITLDRKSLWERKDVIIDPVTGFERDAEYQPRGTIWTVFEPLIAEVDQIMIPVPRYRVVTPAALQIDDRVDGKVVTSVETLLGVTVAEVK